MTTPEDEEDPGKAESSTKAKDYAKVITKSNAVIPSSEVDNTSNSTLEMEPFVGHFPPLVRPRSYTAH